MKLYLAASSADIARAKHWRQKLVDAGIEVTSTWIANVERVGAANPRDATLDQRRGWSFTCLSEVRRSDAFWLLWPHDDSGALIEFGCAIECSIMTARPGVLVVSGDTRKIFCALADEYAADEEAFAAIVEMGAT